MSAKPMIPLEDRLIVALDVPSRKQALALVEALGETVHFYKIGLVLFMGGEGFELLEDLVLRGKKIFVDLKFFDVPQTVGAAVHALSKQPVDFATIHGNDAMIAAAVANRKSGMKLLAVTALTSLDNEDLHALGFRCDVEDLVVSRAQRACALGCDGVVASGREASLIKQALGNRLLVVTPGIRPIANADDQKRTMDVATAFASGADYVVVGRPITQAPDPHTVASNMVATIKSQLEKPV